MSGSEIAVEEVAPPARPLAEWRALREQGMSLDAIGERYGLNGSTIRRWLSGQITHARPTRRGDTDPRWVAVWQAERAGLELTRGMPRCERCGIILERSGDLSHADDSPNAGTCWACRAEVAR